ncbi:MAG: serine hydrolase domain-containing protein, partial [Myxococcota bacterium]|nr:serine hydrolase domain-containing protein [Myxococcota bacterium]
MPILALMLSLAARAVCPAGAEPDGDWRDTVAATRAAVGAADALHALESYAFPAAMDEEGRTGVRTDGLVIVRDGAILYERYGRDWQPDMPHLLWSVTKSVAAATVGIAVHTADLDVDASICDSIEVGAPDACRVTTRHLMEHATGWAWRETYEGQSPTASSVIGMLYGGGQADMARFVTAHALRDAPGTSYSYASGNTVVQSAVAHRVLRRRHGDRYLDDLLLGPLGITSAQFEHDESGVPIGSSTLYMTPRDMARFGVFLLQDGCWSGK